MYVILHFQVLQCFTLSKFFNNFLIKRVIFILHIKEINVVIGKFINQKFQFNVYCFTPRCHYRENNNGPNKDNC